LEKRNTWCMNVARKVQMVQWVFGGMPGHPILGEMIAYIVRQSEGMTRRIMNTRRPDEAEHGDVPSEWILEFTGPGPFTDYVLGYLDQHYRASYLDLVQMEKPILVVDVYIVPLTGFSPGVALGAHGIMHPQARVKHEFAGSWKTEGQKQREGELRRLQEGQR